MIEINKIKNLCTGCTACFSVCPKSAIEMKARKGGFLFPEINKDKCVNCGLCEKVCQAYKDNENIFLSSDNANYFAAYAKEEFMDENSTSGAVASLLMQEFVKQGFKVCGARFSDDLKTVYHKLSDDIGDIKAFAGSKYLQSDLKDTYKEIKKELERGGTVLFTGSSCQAGGLKKYLGKDYENLYIIDFICHGVPAPELWGKYKEYLEEKHKAKLIKYNFRAKTDGWGKITQSAEFEPLKSFKNSGSKNEFHYWFGRHLSLRESCFNCLYRRKDRISDITVADFWKIEEYYPEIPVKQGISAVIVSSDKGEKLLELIKDKIELIPVSEESIFEKRKTALYNFEIPALRQEFMSDADKISIKELIKKYPTESFFKRVKDKLRSMVR